MFSNEWISGTLLAIIGAASGGLVAAGMFAFVTMIGVVTRMTAETRTIRYVMLFEDMVVIGAAVGNVLFFYNIMLHAGVMGAFLEVLFGFFSGVYVGCLSIALAEMLNVVPIFSKRVHLKRGLTAFVLTFAFGKLFGAFLDFFL